MFDHFGHNEKLSLIVCSKIPPSTKQKFTSCGGIVPARMSPLEICCTGGPLRSIGTVFLSQLAHNNLADGPMPNIDVSTSEPPQSQGECSRARSNPLRSNALCQQHMNNAYHNVKRKELDEK
jgi:hypothetical protein